MALIPAWTRGERALVALVALAGLGPLACERSTSEQAMVESELRAAQPLARSLIHGHGRGPLQIAQRALNDPNNTLEESELRPVHSPALAWGGCIGWFIQVDAADASAWAVIMEPDAARLRECARQLAVTHDQLEDKPLAQQGPAQSRRYALARRLDGQPAIYQWHQAADDSHALTWIVARLDDEALRLHPPLATKPLQGFDPAQATLEPLLLE